MLLNDKESNVMKSTVMIGHIKFLQLNSCSMTRPFLSAMGVAAAIN